MLFALAFITACNEDKVFEREQYKHVIAIKSDGVYKIFNQEVDLSNVDADGFANGFIAADVGGSLPTGQAIKLSIVEDPVILDQYNQYNFATVTYKYANYIPDDRKIISDYSISIPAGERSGIMNIRVRPGGLSPDSAYMIPFRVSNVSAYEMNQDESTVLYNLQWKNQWTSTANIAKYSHKGVTAQWGSVGTVPNDGPDTEVNTLAQKDVYPLSVNQVRIFAADHIFTSDVLAIKEWGLILTVDEAGNVKISNVDDNVGPKVVQIDHQCGGGHADWKCQICEPEAYADPTDLRAKGSCHYDPHYNNTYAVVTDQWKRQYKTFLLCYSYTSPDDGKIRVMKEELKIDYVPDFK